MAASLVIPLPRYSAEDFETNSIRSAAPSYQSEAPSYQSAEYHTDALPPYSPPANRTAPSSSADRNNAVASTPRESSTPRQQTIGLPPVPSAPQHGVPSLHNFRIPSWSTRNTPAARQLNSVVERRINARMSESNSSSSSSSSNSSGTRYRSFTQDRESDDNSIRRPLEDPYLVGEVAAAQARRERLSRENGDDILVQEDRQWDWLLAQMKEWDEREKSWARFRREVENNNSRKRIFHRRGGRLI